MVGSRYLSFREDVEIWVDPQGDLTLSRANRRVKLSHLSSSMKEAFSSLAFPGSAEKGLADSILTTDGSVTLARWYHQLSNLCRNGFLTLFFKTDEERLMSFEPTQGGFELSPPAILSEEDVYILSRFAFVRRIKNASILESPLTSVRVVLNDLRSAALVNSLARGVRLKDCADEIRSLSGETIQQMLQLLVNLKFICKVNSKGVAAEDEAPALVSWEFHELLFHSRSRRGRHSNPFGATFPTMDRIPVPAVRKAPIQENLLPLFRPDLDQAKGTDCSLTYVQSDRRSVRKFGAKAITDRQLGEFLFRVARVENQFERYLHTPQGPIQVQFTKRPYPSGGALYELELNILINACEGISPGLYHYEPFQHGLEQISEPNALTKRLLTDAGFSTGIDPASIQVLIVASSRFQRIAWKYASMSYATTLKNVGVLYQTMYLVATAMGLAPCALGAGDSDLFSRAAGTDYYAESSVGEFVLGSKGLE